MIPLSLYQPGESWLHRLYPLTKLVFCLSMIGIIFTGPEEWLSAALPALAALLIAWRAAIVGRISRIILRLLAPLVVILFLIHGWFFPANHTILWRIGPLALGLEGLFFAGLICARLAAALAASLVMVVSTHPAHLVYALEKAGLPHKIAFLLSSPLLLLPQLAGRVQSIQAAQQSRGLETRGSILTRIQAVFPLVAPLVYGALVDVEERSLALEVRGFSSPNPKTSLIELHDSPAQSLARWGLAVLWLLTLGVGIWWRLNGRH